MRLYIAGPMTGLPQFNYPAFFAAEEELLKMGHIPLNPARNDGETLNDAVASAGTPSNPTHTWEWYLRRDIPHAVSADGIVVLPGWQQSRGATLEMHIATALGMPVYILRNGKLEPRITVIGLSGYARSGKDTIGAVLTERGYIRASFADYIREALLALNPTIGGEGNLTDLIENHGWESGKVKFPEVRSLQQRMGTEVGRNMLGENIWVDLTFKNLADGAKVIVTDCRFPNEADTVKRLGGEVWRVSRPGFSAVNAHPSEVSLDDWKFDRYFENSGSVEELHAKVREALKETGF